MDIRRDNARIRKKLSFDNNKSLKPSDVRNIIDKLKELKKQKRNSEYRTLKIDLLSQIIMSSPISPQIIEIIQRYLRNE